MGRVEEWEIIRKEGIDWIVVALPQKANDFLAFFSRSVDTNNIVIIASSILCSMLVTMFVIPLKKNTSTQRSFQIISNKNGILTLFLLCTTDVSRKHRPGKRRRCELSNLLLHTYVSTSCCCDTSLYTDDIVTRSDTGNDLRTVFINCTVLLLPKSSKMCFCRC